MTKNGLLGEANAASEYQINAYVRIGTDNRITILFGGCEFGQGSIPGPTCLLQDWVPYRRP